VSETAESLRAEAETARGQGRLAEAARDYRKALALAPGLAPAQAHLAVVLDASAAGPPAAEAVLRAIALDPGQALLRLNLGIILGRLGRAGGRSAFRQALALDPALGDAWLSLGVWVQREGAASEAERCARRQIALSAALTPGLAAGENNLGNALAAQGRMQEALAAYGRALTRDPGFADAARNLLAFALYLDNDESLAGDKARAFMRRFGPLSMYDRGPPPLDLPAARLEPERVLRVGLLSSDLGDHPVGLNLASLFEHRDRAKTWIAAYDTASRADPASRWFRSRSALWRNVAGFADRRIAELIRADHIDVLVSLAGRFDLNRPLVASWRAAPVQVVMHDGGASGLGDGDDPLVAAWITDRWLHPDGDRAGGDRLLRLPVFYNFLKPDRAPALYKPDPERVVFGSFSNPSKLSPDVLALWARLLKRVPDARLVLKYRGCYGDPGIARRIEGTIAEAGVDPERLVLVSAPEPRHAHLERYGEIDVALDPFPFSGATTSFEALSMGVPVVTLAARAAIGRTTAAILGPLGLEALIAPTEDEYVERAAALAQDRAGLQRLRREIPARLSLSPLLDGRTHAATLEDAFRLLWRERCASERAASVLR